MVVAIVPFANVFGRRQTSLICCSVCVIANIWQAVAKDYNSFLAARFISGLGAAANESIMPMVIADMMFIHQYVYLSSFLYILSILEWISANTQQERTLDGLVLVSVSRLPFPECRISGRYPGSTRTSLYWTCAVACRCAMLRHWRQRADLWFIAGDIS